MTVELLNGRVTIALHRLREAADPQAPTLLLLHELGGSANDWKGETLDWNGPVFALDFTGHGDSGWLRSSAYYPELFLMDADVAHKHIESTGARESCLLGRGIGGYAGLLLAGARPDRIRAAAVLPGAGLAGGGNEPGEFEQLRPLKSRGDPQRDSFDPRVSICDEHARPSEYVGSFAARNRSLHLAKPSGALPSWWSAACEGGTRHCEPTAKAALAALAAAPAIPSEALPA